MSLTEDKCRDSLSDLYYILDGKHCDGCIRDGSKYCAKCNIKEDLSIMRRLVHEHFNNPPLKFEELKEEMVIWDNKRKMFIRVFDVATLEENCFTFEVFGWETPIYDQHFEEGRFYRKQVKE